MATRRLTNLALFICDLQEKFRPAIWEFPKVIATTQKLLRASQILQIPIYATTQNRSRLGPTCADLHLDTTYPTQIHTDKTLFSMCTPLLLSLLPPKSTIAIVGIETHICVTQTTLDLLGRGHRVYVIADGVSSCNGEERGVALERLRGEGARVVSSEGFLYEVMGDADIKEFRDIAKLVKETKESTKESLQALCKM